jgi:ferredoxin-type protein NapF
MSMTSLTQISRRQFQRGDIRGRRLTPPPPWATGGGLFEELCSACDACIDACPESILARSPSGLPTVDFRRGACTFCGACTDSCETGALVRTGGVDPWAHVARVGAGCLALRGVMCESCRDACDSGAIRMSYGVGAVATPRINQLSCTGCGSCVGVCPGDAIEVY